MIDTPAQPTILGKIYFIMMGTTSLLGFNAIMGSLDYFSKHFPDFQAPFYMALPPMASFNVVSLLMPIAASKIAFSTRIIVSLIGMIGFLLLMPMFTVEIESTTLSFTIVMFLSLLWGIFGQLFNSSMVGFACKASHKEYLVSYNIGSSASGIVIILLRILITLAYESNINTSTFIYFLSASVITFLALILQVFFMRTTEFKNIQNYKSNQQAIPLESNVNQNRVKSSQLEIEDNNLPSLENKQVTLHDLKSGYDYEQKDSKESAKTASIELKTPRQSLSQLIVKYIETAKYLMPLPIYMLISNINANMMYPGVSLKSSLIGLSSTWSTIWIVFIHNVLNIVGKWLSGRRSLYNATIIKALVLLRFLHFIIFIINAVNKDQFLYSNVIICLNIALFSLSTGFTDGSIFVLSFEKNLPDQQREHVGFVTAFALTFGIMIGQFVGISFSHL